MKTILGVDSFEEMAARKWTRAKKLSKGEPVRAERRITFARPEDLFACLSPERIRLFNKLRAIPISLSNLAEELQRDGRAVQRDVKVLAAMGLLRLQKTDKSGQGSVQMVTARAKRVHLQAEL